MGQIEKLLEKLSAKPIPNDIKFSDAEKLLLHFRFTKKEGKGSHVKFNHKQLDYHLSLPRDGANLKSIYVKQVIEAIREVAEGDDYGLQF